MRGLFVSNDLMFTSRIQSAAQAAGYSLSIVMSPATLGEHLAGEPVGLVIIDLNSPGNDVATIVSAVRAVAPQARIVSYGPHVDHERLESAARAGCDQVYSRGQFMQEAARLLAETLGTSL